MGEELRRYLDSRPIRSRPDGSPERLWRWCKRSPGLAAASIRAAALTMILLIGSMVAAWVFYNQPDRISSDNLRIQRAGREIRDRLFESLMAQAQARRFSGRIGQRFESLNALERAAEIARELKYLREQFDLIRTETIACLALPDLRPTGRIMPNPANALMVAFDAAMTRYALRFRDGSIQVRRADDDAEVARFQSRVDRDISALSLSPDGR